MQCTKLILTYLEVRFVCCVKAASLWKNWRLQDQNVERQTQREKKESLVEEISPELKEKNKGISEAQCRCGHV